jgi:hypothetical protein
VSDLVQAYREMTQRRAAAASEVGAMIDELERMQPALLPPVSRPRPPIDYLGLVTAHNRRVRSHRA